ncbi:hypothetical protein WA026_011259 [Henosepilachna vigintioctopunctata]|uniref:Reverse transcriptase domain-containing protein n=1 Tax=Henosepilachna vigintioctopunctata TaxID=420089 RepID=A0AAW1U648_9CUCU
MNRNIYNAFDARTSAICVLVDLAKTFDIVSHLILVKIMKQLGAEEVDTHNSMKKYLKNKEYVVVIDGVGSTGQNDSVWGSPRYYPGTCAVLSVYR